MGCILIYSCTVSRMGGGIFFAVRDLYNSKPLSSQCLEVVSYKDFYSSIDVETWNRHIHISLFKALPFLYSTKARAYMLGLKNINLLHVHGLWRYPHAFMHVWKHYKKCPVVCTPHGMLDPYIIKNQGCFKRFVGGLLFTKRGLASVDVFHALCIKELKDIRTYGLKQPVAIIPNGVKLPNGNITRMRVDNKRHLLYLGRLHKKKGVDLLLHSIANISKKYPDMLDNWIVDLVGWDDENCRENLEKIVKNNRLDNLIIFHGALFDDDKNKMYAQADAYILPSHGEGLPISILEAWSWSLPVIMTPYCNLHEGFKCGAAIEIEDNVESVERGIKDLFSMTNIERENMGKKGRLLVEKEFTWEASAKKMNILYEWLIKGGEKPDFLYLD